MLRSDAHQRRFLSFENLRAVSPSNRGLIYFGSGLVEGFHIRGPTSLLHIARGEDFLLKPGREVGNVLVTDLVADIVLTKCHWNA